MPNSPQADDEQQLASWQPFLEQPLVVTIKMDGSNVCLSHDRVAARNGQTAAHASFSLLKERFAHHYQALLPPGLQVFGEWCFAQHSIAYTNDLALSNYLQLFSVYDQVQGLFLDWDAVEAWAARLGVPTTPVVEAQVTFHTAQALDHAMTIWAATAIDAGHEGVVVRTRHPFPNVGGVYTTHNGKNTWAVAFIAKYVRHDHNQCGPNWKSTKVTKNSEKQ